MAGVGSTRYKIVIAAGGLQYTVLWQCLCRTLEVGFVLQWACVMSCALTSTCALTRGMRMALWLGAGTRADPC